MRAVIEVNIGDIRPDPDQPRKVFNEQQITELAQSIKQEGVINPIEIDKDNVILTGERRWRASKVARLEVVPCIVNDLTGKERFKHQLAENLHHNTMSEMDVARSLQKLLVMYKVVSPGKKTTGRPPQGVSWLAEQTGKSAAFITERLSLLSQTAKFKKAVEEARVPATMVRALNACPPEHKEKLEQKILDRDIETRDAAHAIATHLAWDRDNAEILNASYKGMSTADVVTELRSKAPTPQQQASKKIDKALEYEDINKLAVKLKNKLSERTLGMYSEVAQKSLARYLETLAKDIEGFLEDGMVTALIEGEIID